MFFFNIIKLSNFHKNSFENILDVALVEMILEQYIDSFTEKCLPRLVESEIKKFHAGLNFISLFINCRYTSLFTLRTKKW